MPSSSEWLRAQRAARWREASPWCWAASSLALRALSFNTWKASRCATGTSSAAAPGEDSSAEAISVAWSNEISPCWRASLNSPEAPSTLPVATTALAFPTEVPVTRASSDASFTLRASAATRRRRAFRPGHRRRATCGRPGPATAQARDRRSPSPATRRPDRRLQHSYQSVWRGGATKNPSWPGTPLPNATFHRQAREIRIRILRTVCVRNARSPVAGLSTLKRPSGPGFHEGRRTR
jgi:hypothetical protein